MYIGSKIEVLERVDSTNEYLKNNAGIYPDGAIVSAKVQTKGRGRFERKWISDVIGNLYCSILVKDITWLKTPTHLPIFMSVVLRRAIMSTLNDKQAEIFFKWPNDLLSAKGEKFSGILVEAGQNFFVIGIGLNMVKAPHLEGKKVSSLKDISPIYKDLKPEHCMETIKNTYNLAVKEYLSEGFIPFKKEWEQFCSHINKKVALSEGIDDNTPQKNLVTFKHLNDDGGAWVTDDSGKERVIYYGEIV
jgi:BirA family transcriptional regulator, biotin operon repressor / biotin---[acetyl-CoA-carboxylase] ligase